MADRDYKPRPAKNAAPDAALFARREWRCDLCNEVVAGTRAEVVRWGCEATRDHFFCRGCNDKI